MTFTFREELHTLFGSIIIAKSSCRARSLHVPPSFERPSKLQTACAVMNVKPSQKQTDRTPDDFTFNAWVAHRPTGKRDWGYEAAFGAPRDISLPSTWEEKH